MTTRWRGLLKRHTGPNPLSPSSPLSAPQVISMVKRPSLTPAGVLLAVARLAIWF
jgi:hypothetical protein